MFDIADRLYDRRSRAPEPEEWSPPLPGEEAAYYASPDGTPCPNCKDEKPWHEPSCFMKPEFEPSYRLTPADFQDDPWGTSPF